MDASVVQITRQSLIDVPYDQRWEILKSTIERLYARENWKLKDIITVIEDQCGFRAVESQYKYQIKKWQFKKSTSNEKKAAVCKVVQKRAQLGKSSAITRSGQSLDSKNIRRFLKKEARKEIALHPVSTEASENTGFLSSRVAQFGNRIFMNWNMPYGLGRPSAAGASNHTSPLSDMMVTTPISSHDAPSPLAVAIQAMTTMDRTRLLLEGRHNDLLRSMESQQRVTMSTWLYHFWLFSFKTAKHWGVGPQAWTADILGLDGSGSALAKPVLLSQPATPATNSSTPVSQHTSRADRTFDTGLREHTTSPTSLCRWSIHYRGINYQSIPSPPHSPPGQIDLDDEESWPAWPGFHTGQEFVGKLTQGLEKNNFTTVGSGGLPVSINKVVRAAQLSPEELHQEALGFSIMSRNSDLVSDLLEKSTDLGYDGNGFYPFHLAVAYLDGSKSCCNILDTLMISLPLRKIYVNELGHTVLDQLMIAILKAHTSCAPIVADSFFKKGQRFEGEDVDICGRWDADSACIRNLLANGTPSIPFRWKHMFCHTSVQTICHCIGTLFGLPIRPNIDTPSGLFVRRCSHCGLKLQLLPLHALLIVGLHLSQSGCEGETLFGILACLLCLLSKGADPRLTADICFDALFDNEESHECTHKSLNPVQLANYLLATFKSMWTKEISTTWEVVYYVLKQSLKEWKRSSPQSKSHYQKMQHINEFDSSVQYIEDDMDTNSDNDEETSLPTDCGCELGREYHKDNFFGRSKSLATLWAAVKTELLTYRRLTEDDPWLSHNFNISSLNRGLHDKHRVSIPLVEKQMMKSYAECGRFEEQAVDCTLADEACAYYFSNMDDWGRTTFISAPDDRIQFLYC